MNGRNAPASDRRVGRCLRAQLKLQSVDVVFRPSGFERHIALVLFYAPRADRLMPWLTVRMSSPKDSTFKGSASLAFANLNRTFYRRLVDSGLRPP